MSLKHIPYTFRITLFLLVILIHVIYFGIFLNVESNLSLEDTQAISNLNANKACTRAIGDFESEINCILAIQRSVQEIGIARCASYFETVEPKEFLARGYGCCTDRSRFIEKAARYYGFETRHVFMIERLYGANLSIFLPLRQPSHAASEIKTSRGWLGVDSNESFMLMDQTGRVSTYREALASGRSKFPMRPQSFFDKDLIIIYGLYSRHGFFHGWNFPGPEISWREFLYNFRKF